MGGEAVDSAERPRSRRVVLNAPTRILVVNKTVLDEYHKGRAAIRERYPLFDEVPEGANRLEHWSNMAALRGAALIELREEMRRKALDFVFVPGEWRYAIAV